MSRRRSDEAGQALIIALLALAIGSLLVAVFLYCASTSQLTTKAAYEETRDRYSADAGVEHALWRIKNDSLFYDSLAGDTQMYTRSINDTSVAISVTHTNPGVEDLPPCDVRVEPQQASYVFRQGSTRTYDVFVINAGGVTSTFAVSMTFHFETQSGRIDWTVEVQESSGTTVYGPQTFSPDKGTSQTSVGIFDTTPQLTPGSAEPYSVIVSKGHPGGGGNSLDIEFTACCESTPAVCDSSWLGTSVQDANTPAIGMTKMATPFVVGHGDRITYTLVCENAGDAPADRVVVTDTLPAEMQARFVAASASCSDGTIAYSSDGGTSWDYTPVGDSEGLDGAVDAIRWELTDLPAGASEALTFSVQVNDPYTSTETTVPNQASASWWEGSERYGPTTAAFYNPVELLPRIRIAARAPNVAILATIERDEDGQLYVLSWQIQ